MSEQYKVDKFTKEDDEEVKTAGPGLFSSWQTERKSRLEKIKQAKERPSAPLLEELQEKPSIKDVKMRKLVNRDPTLENIARDIKDDYI